MLLNLFYILVEKQGTGLGFLYSSVFSHDMVCKFWIAAFIKNNFSCYLNIYIIIIIVFLQVLPILHSICKVRIQLFQVLCSWSLEQLFYCFRVVIELMVVSIMNPEISAFVLDKYTLKIIKWKVAWDEALRDFWCSICFSLCLRREYMTICRRI